MTLATENLPARTTGSNGGGRPMATIKNIFEAAKGRMAEVAPKHLKPERLMRVALLTISKTPALANCTPHSLLNAFMTASQLGLEIGGVLGEAYLVPYKQEATFIVGYRGLINLARRSGQILSVEAQVVRDGDEFDFEYGLETRFRHKPKAPTDAPITHVWALARFRDGGHQLDVMGIDEVTAVRKRSRASNNGPWVTDFAEMAKKTVVRRLCKYLPLSPEMVEAIEASDLGEFGGFIDGQTVEGMGTKRPFGPPQPVIAHPTAENLVIDTSDGNLPDPQTAEEIIANAPRAPQVEQPAPVAPEAPAPPEEAAPGTRTFADFLKAAEAIAKEQGVDPEVFDGAMERVVTTITGINSARTRDVKVRQETLRAMAERRFDWQAAKVKANG